MEAKRKRNNWATKSHYQDATNDVWAMTDEEIRNSWRRCRNKEYHVRIIAELNARSIKDTVKKLKSLGIDVDEKRATACFGNEMRKSWTQKDIDKLIRLHDEGKSWKEIGYELDRSGGSVQNKYLRMKWGGVKAPCKN